MPSRRKRRYKATRYKHLHIQKKERRRRELVKLGVVAAGIGALAGWAKYKINVDRIEYSAKALLDKKADNGPPSLELQLLYESALSPDGKALYQEILDIGGPIAGDFQWFALKKIFSKHDIPFWPPYVDITDKDFIGKGIKELQKSDVLLDFDVHKWVGLRRDIKARVIADKKNSKMVLIKHMELELLLEFDLRKVEEERQELFRDSAIAGVGVGALAFTIPIAIYLLVLAKRKGFGHIRRKMAKRKARRQKSKAAKDGKKAKPEIDVASEAPTQDIRAEKRKANGEERKKLLEEASGVLTEMLGKETSQKLLRSLGKKVSMRVLREVAEGKYSHLVRIMKRSKKMLETRIKDVDTVLLTLKGEKPAQPKASNDVQEETKKRLRHPLDDVKRWGWKPSKFHKLLQDYGFDTSEATGSGHYFVCYKGEKLRHSDGRFVVIPHQTSGTEITPGIAGNVMKACADFLVEREQ